MSTKETKSLIQELMTLLDEPWNNNAEENSRLFHEIGELHSVTLLVSNVLSSKSSQAIRNLSSLLAYVEEYKDEIASLYLWTDGVIECLDEYSAGAIATAIQRHIAILGIQLPLEPGIEKVMIPFLLKSLIANDWTIRLSAVSSLDMLDGYCRLGKWLTKAQLAELRQNLQVHLALDEEQALSPSAVGRLKRFVKK